jgi:hypothetical protein
MTSLVERFRHDVRDGYVLGPVRVAVGLLLFACALQASQELASIGYFGDAFHVPMISGAFIPSSRLFVLVVALRLCLSTMVVLGVWARPALALSGGFIVWQSLCDRLHFDHEHYALALYAALLAWTPCDRSFRIHDSSVTTVRRAPFWGVRLCQIQVSLVYLASANSKMASHDWQQGHYLAERIALHRMTTHLPLAASLGHWVSHPFAPNVMSALATLCTMTELSLCVALWLRPTRTLALWVGLWFHVLIFAIAGAGISSGVTLAMYGVFATPDFRARKLHFDPTRLRGRLAGALVPAFDWLQRFEVRPWEPDGQPGHSIVIEERNGERRTGLRAFATIVRTLPLLFPFWAPVAWLATFERQRTHSVASIKNRNR